MHPAPQQAPIRPVPALQETETPPSSSALEQLLKLRREQPVFQAIDDSITNAASPDEAQQWIEGPLQMLVDQQLEAIVRLSSEERQDKRLQAEERRADGQQKINFALSVLLLVLGFALLYVGHGELNIFTFLAGIFLTGGVVASLNSVWAELFLRELPRLLGRDVANGDPK